MGERRWCQRCHVVAIVLVLLAGSVTVQAASFDPHLKWRTIRTPHFKINYTDELEAVAEKAARIFEEVHATLSPALSWQPWGPTEIVLVDASDDANGFTTILPYNWIILYVVPPRAGTLLANYDDWLKLLISHEYTHVLHLDAARGIWRPVRLLLGKTVSPAGLVPVWIKEGFATYEETKNTTGGRGRSTLTDMFIRTAVLEGKFPAIDQADGLQWEWPSYLAAYLYGVEFIQYLVATYGEEKFFEFNRRVSSSLLLSAVNGRAKSVYGKTFTALWREWYGVLKERYAREAEALGSPTPLSTVVTVKRDERYEAIALSPDGATLAFAVESPHHAAQIRLLDLASGAVKTVRKKQGASAIAWLPDGSGFIYATLGVYKTYDRFFDLWRYDVATGKATALTQGARARDPAVDPSGKKVLFVASAQGRDHLRVFDLETKSVSNLAPDAPGTAFAHPAWSPDGTSFVVTMHTLADGWKLSLFSADGKWRRRLTTGKGTEFDARWSADGKEIFYSSDETGITNIYRIAVGGGVSQRLSTVTTGLFEPQTKDGKTFFVQHYQANGFDIQQFSVEKAEPAKRNGSLRVPPSISPAGRAGGRADRPADSLSTTASSLGDNPSPGKKYSAFGTSLLLPRFLAPNIFFTGETTIISAATGSTDPLQWHRWSAGGTYRFDAQHFGYFGSYAYSRFRPTFGVGVDDFAVNFGRLTFDTDGNLATTADRRTVNYFEERRSSYAYVTYPYKRHAVSTAFFYEDRFPQTPLSSAEAAALSTGIFSGFRFVYGYADPELYPASISLENGRRVRLMTSVTNSLFGSDQGHEQVIFSGDWREYVRLWEHHTLGFRAAGGITWGDRLFLGTFGMGGALGEGTLATGGGSFFYFPLRGLPVASLARTRAMLFSSEYRIPLVAPQRGLGTTPIFLKNIHAATFADYGNAWNAHEAGSDSFSHFFDQFFLSVGAELRGDFVIGHGLPLVGRLGYAIVVVNRDRLDGLVDDILGTSIKNGMLILQFGTSF